MSFISTRVFKTSQTWNFERIVKTSDKQKLKVLIVRNAYDSQSYARVSRWNGDKWEHVNGLSIGECECQKVSYISNNVSERDFENDFTKLLKTAIEIIS